MDSVKELGTRCTPPRRMLTLQSPRAKRPACQVRVLAIGEELTFFHADFGKEFPSRTFWRDPSRNRPSPSSALCHLLYRAKHFSRGIRWRKRTEKRGGRGVASRKGKKEKRSAKTGQRMEKDEALMTVPVIQCLVIAVALGEGKHA